MTETRELIRRVRFQPYRKGRGPTFYLLLWDTHRRKWGKNLVGYQLSMRANGWSKVLFEGEDFGCSPLHAIDSDATIAGIMGFLTLRPGDTNDEYFRDYTPTQLDYCDQHAEALDCEVRDRGFED